MPERTPPTSRLCLVLLTAHVWLAGCAAFVYYKSLAHLSNPDLYGYERSAVWPLIGFLLPVFPFCVVGLFVAIVAELALWEL